MILPRAGERSRVGLDARYLRGRFSELEQFHYMGNRVRTEVGMKYEGILEVFFERLRRLEYPVRAAIRDGESVRELVYRCGLLDKETEDASQTSLGMRTVMSEVRSASGHPFHALLDIRVTEANELWGTRLVVPGLEDGEEHSLVSQGTVDFEACVGALKATVVSFEMFPYNYRYLDRSLWGNGHVDPETGWS